MNRCIPRRTLLATLALALSTSVWAQWSSRPFPPQAARGVMVVTQAPAITLNGKAERLSPGARIRNAQNQLVLSASLTGQELVVNYTRESMGLVHEVWILTPAEAAEKRPTEGS